MRTLGGALAVTLASLSPVGCRDRAPTSVTTVRESTMNVHELKATASVKSATLKDAADLEVTVVVTNTSSHDVKLNTLFFGFTVIMLKVRQSDGVPVHSGPPPMPPLDDGQRARVTLPPGGTLTLSYRGRDYFAQDIPDGDYDVRFRHESLVSMNGDWLGLIESEWVPFRVRR